MKEIIRLNEKVHQRKLSSTSQESLFFYFYYHEDSSLETPSDFAVEEGLKL